VVLVPFVLAYCDTSAMKQKGAIILRAGCLLAVRNVKSGTL
jgi:hypothetical protein